MTISPQDLTAVVRETYPPPPPLKGWLGFYYDSGFYDSEQGTKEDAGWYCSGKVHPDREEALCELAGFRPFEGSALVEVGRALFTPESEKPAQEEPAMFAYTATPGDSVRVVSGDGSKWICSQPAPVAAVRMTESLERVLAVAQRALREAPGRPDHDVNVIALKAVRDQAATQPVKLAKVRELLRLIEWSYGGSDTYDAALAELDEAEGR